MSGMAWLLALVLSAWAAVPAQARSTPDDFGCRSDDDTGCWIRAVRSAVPARGLPWFGDVEGLAGRTYVVRDTIALSGSVGGVIDGRGSVIEWHGPPDRPLFLLTNVQQLKITNLNIFAVTPLQAAFEFTKGPYGKDPNRNVAPRLNVLDSVRVQGVKLGNLAYGVRFTARNGIDEDNDQSTIFSSTFANVSEAAISIEHSQSKAHHFYAVHASGADGNRDAAFVRKRGGSFSSVGGFHGGFRGAVYDIAGGNDLDLIVDENSEASARLLRTPTGVASFPLPVQVVGGRFAVDGLAPDGRFIDFHRMGPLTITGLRLDGVPPPASQPAVLAFLPNPQTPGGQASLTVTGLALLVPSSESWEGLAASPIARVTATGNTCVDSRVAVTACRGPLAGIIGNAGITYADLTTGTAAHLAPGHSAYCLDCNSTGVDGRCTGGGSGRFARRRTDGWFCD